MGNGQNNQNWERQEFSLLELNNRVKEAVLNAFPETCWVRAEMSDVRQNAASGHCYLDVPDVEALFSDGNRADVCFRPESAGEGVGRVP